MEPGFGYDISGADILDTHDASPFVVPELGDPTFEPNVFENSANIGNFLESELKVPSLSNRRHYRRRSSKNHSLEFLAKGLHSRENSFGSPRRFPAPSHSRNGSAGDQTFWDMLSKHFPQSSETSPRRALGRSKPNSPPPTKPRSPDRFRRVLSHHRRNNSDVRMENVAAVVGPSSESVSSGHQMRPPLYPHSNVQQNPTLTVGNDLHLQQQRQQQLSHEAQMRRTPAPSMQQPPQQQQQQTQSPQRHPHPNEQGQGQIHPQQQGQTPVSSYSMMESEPTGSVNGGSHLSVSSGPNGSVPTQFHVSSVSQISVSSPMNSNGMNGNGADMSYNSPMSHRSAGNHLPTPVFAVSPGTPGTPMTPATPIGTPSPVQAHVVSTSAGKGKGGRTTKETIRKLKKNSRERERRTEMNDRYEDLCRLLNVQTMTNNNKQKDKLTLLIECVASTRNFMKQQQALQAENQRLQHIVNEYQMNGRDDIVTPVTPLSQGRGSTTNSIVSHPSPTTMHHMDHIESTAFPNMKVED